MLPGSVNEDDAKPELNTANLTKRNVKPADVVETQSETDAVKSSGCENSLPSAPKAPQVDQKISMRRKIIFSAPTVATLPFVAMWGMYGNQNYQAFGASISMIALFTALARSFDVVSDPLMSYLTDSASCSRLPRWLRGRRKPFMFFGCFFYSTFLFLLLNPPYASKTNLSVWFGIMYTLYFISNTVTCIPYDALAPELSEDSTERTGLFFIANLFDGCGTLVALGLPIVLTHVATGSNRNEDICVTDTMRAEMCLLGRSCGDFFFEGWGDNHKDIEYASYKPNTSLASLFAELTNITVSDDATRGCSSGHAVLGPNVTTAQNDGFCQCMNVCASACEVANKRTGFMLVGSFFSIWMLVTMVTAVCRIPEREMPVGKQKTPPIVPSMRSAMSNKPFRVLLPAWLCDAFVNAIVASLLPYFVEAVVAPAYQTKKDHGKDCYPSGESFEGGKWKGDGGRKDSDTYDALYCETSNVIAVSGILCLCTAIVALPFWNFVVRRVGKVKAWLLWSLAMATTNLLFVFAWKGGVHYLWFAAAMNGIPLGAKFLADAVLADIIDYDEFLTGMRSEATYFMFKSFLPKIVQIPSSAIPIALLGAFGYIPPEGGKVQDQSETAVPVYIKFVVGLGFVFSLLAFYIKTKYPLKESQVEALTEGLQKHKRGEWANDPISKTPWKPVGSPAEDEQTVDWLLKHFSLQQLQELFPKFLSLSQEGQQKMLLEGTEELLKAMTYQLTGAVVFLMLSITGTAATIQLLWSDGLSFVPTLFVVCVGMGISSTSFASLRFSSSKKLSKMAIRQDPDLSKYVAHVLEHLQEMEHLGVNEEGEIGLVQSVQSGVIQTVHKIDSELREIAHTCEQKVSTTLRPTKIQ